MDFQKLKELIKLVDSSSLAFFEFKGDNNHIKMDKSVNRELNYNNSSEINNENNSFNSTNLIEKSEIYTLENNKLESYGQEVIIEDENFSFIISPLVGIFYSSASPQNPAFTEVGATVSKGKAICIIEAMKLMNEIQSDYSGVVVERLVNDGDMVEYGQPLFKIKEE